MTYPFKIRCSSLGRLMGGFERPKAELSEDAKSVITEIAIKNKYGREILMSSKETMKGNAVEDDSIALYSKVKGIPYIKSRKYYENDYLTGHVDLRDTEKVIDIKSPYSLQTYAKAKMTPEYAWQLTGYMILTGLARAELAYCLVNAPDALIFDELGRTAYSFKIFKEQEHEYGELEDKVRKNMTYDDIPEARRVMTFSLAHDPEKEKMIMDKMILGSDYYNFIYSRI